MILACCIAFYLLIYALLWAAGDSDDQMELEYAALVQPDGSFV